MNVLKSCHLNLIYNLFFPFTDTFFLSNDTFFPFKDTISLSSLMKKHEVWHCKFKTFMTILLQNIRIIMIHALNSAIRRIFVLFSFLICQFLSRLHLLRSFLSKIPKLITCLHFDLQKQLQQRNNKFPSFTSKAFHLHQKHLIYIKGSFIYSTSCGKSITFTIYSFSNEEIT